MRKKVVKASKGPKEKAFTCPKCHNNTLYDLSESVTRVADVDYGDQFICDECGAEFYAEPKVDGTIQFKTKKPKGRQTYVEAALVDTPQSVIDELIEILGKYGFILDPQFKTNPGKTWMGNTHLQVINPDSYVNEFDSTVRDYVSRALIDEIHELDERSACPITWNFGANAEGQVTGGLDVMKQYVPDDIDASTKIESATKIPEPYNKYFELDSMTTSDDDFHPGDVIPGYDAKFLAYLAPKSKYESIIDSWPILTDDREYPVCDLVGGRLVPVDLPGDIDSSCKVEGANYGGAYDIDPEMFFTKEDIMEFGNEVCEKLTEKFDKPFDIADTYIELPQKLSLFVSDPDWNEYSCSVPLDMRRIKIPADLTRKYLDTFVDSLSADIEKDAEIYSATTLPEGQIRRKAKDLHDELLETAADLLQSADFGFDLSDVADMLTIDVQTPRQPNDPIRVELRCELSYTGMRKLEDALDPVVQQYDADAYFDDVEPGIAEAFIRV